MTVQQILGIFDAFKLKDASVVFKATIEWHTDRPWAREHRVIGERCLVHDRVSSHWCVSLLNTQCGAGKVAGAVKPGFSCESLCVDNEGITVPATV